MKKICIYRYRMRVESAQPTPEEEAQLRWPAYLACPCCCALRPARSHAGRLTLPPQPVCAVPRSTDRLFVQCLDQLTATILSLSWQGCDPHHLGLALAET